MERATGEHAAETLHALVARFELRRRATTVEFGIGVRLADRGAVAFGEQTAHAVHGCVRDGDVAHRVELASRAGTIAGWCDCAAADAVCRHQVALAHALWERDQAGSAS